MICVYDYFPLKGYYGQIKHKKKKDAFPICSLTPPKPKVLHRVKKTVKKMEAAGVAPTFPCP